MPRNCHRRLDTTTDRPVVSHPGDRVFDEVRMLQPGEFDGKPVFEVAHHAALHIAERDQRADRRTLIGGDAGARLRNVYNTAGPG